MEVTVFQWVRDTADQCPNSAQIVTVIVQRDGRNNSETPDSKSRKHMGTMIGIDGSGPLLSFCPYLQMITTTYRAEFRINRAMFSSASKPVKLRLL